MGKTIHIDLTELRLKLSNPALTLDTIAHQYGCSLSHISKLKTEMTRARNLLPPPALDDAPSPSMLRLAEFDPVVARAVRVRLGLEEDTLASAAEQGFSSPKLSARHQRPSKKRGGA